MKRFPVARILLLALVVSVAAVGCRKNPKTITPIPGRTAGGPGGTVRPGDLANLPGDTSGSLGDNGSSVSKLRTTDSGTELPGSWDPSNFNKDTEAFRQQTVYFDFDRSTVKSSERSKIESVAALMKNEPRTMLEIEGHCDERGTPEYNRSLGERRALAIREYLIGLGIMGERINTISYGEDRPADPGHGETAWALNRRGQFILLRPK